MNAMFKRPAPISISNRLRGRVFAQGPEALDVAALGRQFGLYHAEVSVQAATIADQGATIEALKKDIDRLGLQIAGERTNGGGKAPIGQTRSTPLWATSCEARAPTRSNSATTWRAACRIRTFRPR